LRTKNPKGLNTITDYKPEIDSLKGILITLIVVGHNYWFSEFYPIAFATLYNFHVVSFLLLPVLTLKANYSLSKLSNQVFRLTIPHVFFFLVLSALYFTLYVEKTPERIDVWLGYLQTAAVFQNEGFLKQATGFRHLWFLPAMITMLVFLYIYFRGNDWFKGLFILFALVLHITIGNLDSSILIYFPWGSSLIIYIIFPALIIYRCSKLIQWRWYSDLIVISLFMFLTIICYKKHLFTGLAGDIQMPGLENISRIIFHDLVLIISFFGIFRIAYYLRNSFLTDVGRYSLQIFLFQPLIWQLFWQFGGHRLEADTGISRIILVLSSIATTMGTTFLLSRYLVSLKIGNAVFPRNFT
jgi:fucose 4-O-acetylase-like acetyltransferase